MANTDDQFKKVIAHAKEYGFIFPSSEIYDGLGAVYDYGQNGVELKKNIREYWWRAMVQMNENIVGIDAAIFMHPTTWKASGHVDAFNDPLIDNKDSKKRYRADVLVEDYVAKLDDKIEKEIAKVVRYGAKNLAMEETYDPKITIETIEKILGPARLERDKYEDNEVAGVVTGLAWTSVGGDILFIESALSKGKGVLNITGNLGQVMKESATIALEYLKSNADRYNLDPKLFESYDVHIHVPEGATPKDGPSAGVAMLTSLMSLFTQKRVKKNLAMTGEITLRGKVLAVGGLKEKILAGKRAGIKEYILCKDNEKEILEIKEEYRKGLIFHYVTDMEEVIRLAITNEDVKHKKVLTFDE